MRSIAFLTFGLVLLLACESSEERNAQASTETRDVRSRFENGQEDEIYIYMGTDSLNRKEVKYYSNGVLLSEGTRREGKKEGLWRSYHLDGSLWSVHQYAGGVQTGDYNVWHRNGNLRISGAFKDGEESGKWYFMSEQGDTIRVMNYDGLH